MHKNLLRIKLKISKVLLKPVLRVVTFVISIGFLLNFFNTLAAAYSWIQTDWSGGSGQTSWTVQDRFSSESNIEFSNSGEISLAPTSGWYNTLWKYRKELIIDNTKVAGTTPFSNFTILVSLPSDTHLADNAMDNGYDIVFTSSDGVTELDHEREEFNGTTGKLISWVQIPTLNAQQNTSIYLYYGNGSSLDMQDESGTWSGSYGAVWHLEEDPTSTAPQTLDSTTNNNNGTAEGDMDSGDLVAGKIGNAIDIDGGNARIRFTDNSSMEPTSELTLSAWVKNHANACWGKVVSKDYYGSGSWSNPYVSYSLSSSYGCDATPYSDICTSASTQKHITSTALVDDTWYHLVATWNGSVMKYYIDGSPNNGQTNKSGTLDYTNNSDVTIGNRSPYTPGEGYNGVIDEVRILNTALSDDWIMTEYTNQDDPSSFYSVGSQVPIYNNDTGVLTSSIYDTSQPSNWDTLNITSTTSANTSFTVKVRTSNNSDMSGATDFASCNAVNDGEDLSSNNCISDVERYVQYQLSLTSIDKVSSPTIQEIEIGYDPSDTDAPIISNIVSSSTYAGATITWTTNEAASSQIEYGLDQSYGAQTIETDTSPRVLSHSVTINGLVECSIMNYRVVARDALSNESYSSNQIMTIGDCVGSSDVESYEISNIDYSTGGSINMLEDGKGITIDIPANYNNESVQFQIIELNGYSVYNELSNPDGVKIIGEYLYDIKALEDTTTTLDNFSRPILITINYDQEAVGKFKESSLTIMRWDGSNWNELENCTSDTDSDYVQCETSSFSIITLVGKRKSSDNSDDGSKKCNAEPPGSTAPWIYETEVIDNNAVLLKFKSADSPVDHYDLEAGYSEGDYIYGPMRIGNEYITEYKVENLAPSTLIHFRIRGKNGCAEGPWSNDVQVNIGGAYNEIPVTYRDVNKCGDHTVLSGESLWTIAQNYYGDGTLYPKLISANLNNHPSLSEDTMILDGWNINIPCEDQ